MGFASEVFNIVALRDPITVPGDIRDGGNLLGHHLCVRGLAKILGVGAKKVFSYRKVAALGQPCPLDGRLAKASCQIKAPKKAHARQLIHDFLTEIYIKHSEPMPDVQGQHEGRFQTNKALRFRVRKGKRPRKIKKRDTPLTENTAKELRLLPPGNYTEYLRLFEGKHPDCKVSLKLFMRAAWY